MLDSHPDLVVGPELDFLEPPDLSTHIISCCDLLAADDPRVRGHGVQTADPDWQPGVQFVRQCERSGIDAHTLRRLVLDCMGRGILDARDFASRAAVVELIGEHLRARARARRWGIKIQRAMARARDFADRWPHAQFVHIVRDGRDVAASHLLGRWPWAYASIDEAARGWRAVVEAVPSAAPRDRLFELRYEDLVLHPETTLRPLLVFLDVPWDDAVLRHHAVRHSLVDRPFDHPSAVEAAAPVRRDAVGRHRTDLEAAQVAEFERIASSTLQRWGYPLTVTAGTIAP